MIDWPTIVSGAGLIATFSLSLIALARTIKQEKKNKAAENLDEIFEGNQRLLENYAQDNKSLRMRVTELEAEIYTIKHEHQVELDRVTSERNDLGHRLLKAQKENARLIVQLGGQNA